MEKYATSGRVGEGAPAASAGRTGERVWSSITVPLKMGPAPRSGQARAWVVPSPGTAWPPATAPGRLPAPSPRPYTPGMASTLTSKRYSVEGIEQAIDMCFDHGWTDGLPVVPPTEARVRAMLEAARLEPDQQIAFITNRQVAVIAEKVAINAVMSGCLPEYMPVVVAAIEGIADPKWGYHGP